MKPASNVPLAPRLPSQTKKIVKLIVWTLTVVVLLASIGLVVKYDFLYLHFGYDRVRAEFDATSLGSLPSLAELSVSPNPAWTLLAGINYPGPDRDSIIGASESASERTARLRRRLGRISLEQKEAIERASRMDSFAFPLSQGPGQQSRWSLAQSINQIVRDLCLESELRMIEGNNQASIAALQKAILLTNLVDSDPTLLGDHLASGWRLTVLVFSKKLALAGKQDAAFLRALSTALARMDCQTSPVLSLRYEARTSLFALANLGYRADWIEALTTEEPYAGEAIYNEALVFAYGAESIPAPKSILAKSISIPLMKFWIAAARHVDECGDDLTELKKRLKRESQVLSQGGASSRLAGHGVRESAVVLDVTPQSTAILLTFRAMLLLQAAKAEGRGKLRMTDLPGEFPDPFREGSSLQSRWEGDRPTVWSVGTDGLDQNGEPYDDVVATLPATKS